MYVNERGEVNYHGFIKALRERQQVFTEVACKGVCTVSGWNRFENGNRLAEKLMGDRLVARLGVSGEKYEDYLQPKEYFRWLHRMRIVQAIENMDLSKAKEELEAYEISCVHNCLNSQFIHAMRYMILMKEDASDEVLLEEISAAVKCTVPNVQKGLAGAQLLCDQEVNLILEQMRRMVPKKSVVDVSAWRISEYEKLLTYIDGSHWENLQKAKVYPKIACYMGQLLLERETTEVELRRGLEVGHHAMELLRDTSRSFYLIEICETREALATRLLAMEIDSAERTTLESMLQENAEWKNALKELCEEHNLKTHMSDFCYLYYETECYNMVEVMEKRRTMLGLSRVRLSDGICNDRTIIRCEREGRNLSVEVMRRLYEKLGLCAEYRRAQMVTTDVEVVNAYYNELMRSLNRQDYENALNCLQELKRKSDLSLLYNKQEIERVENYVLYHSKRIDAKEFAERVVATLGYTIDIAKLETCKTYYFTRAELWCLHDIAFEVESEVTESCLKIIEKICSDAMKVDLGDSGLFTYEYMMERMASQLGDWHRYEESDEMSRIILKECLKHYRIDNLASLVYNQIWNYQQNHKDLLCDKSYVNQKLQICICLSKLMKKYNAAAFFQMKSDDVI